MVTASHNPPQYNGMKLVGEGALPLSAATPASPSSSGACSSMRPVPPRRRAAPVDSTTSIPTTCATCSPRSTSPRCAPTGSSWTPPTASPASSRRSSSTARPLRRIELYFEVDGSFPNHEPNPLLEENSRELRARVVAEKADLGIAWDGDADRCFFIDETGEFVPGDFVTALLAEALLRPPPGRRDPLRPARQPGRARHHHAPTAAWPCVNRVGHAFFKQRMRREPVLFGGEVSGHYYFPANYNADSGFIPALLILELLSRKGATMAELLEPLRARYFISRRDQLHGRRRAGRPGSHRAALRRRARSASWTASRSTTRTGTSTCGPPTPSRCCASTWAPTAQAHGGEARPRAGGDPWRARRERRRRGGRGRSTSAPSSGPAAWPTLDVRLASRRRRAPAATARGRLHAGRGRARRQAAARPPARPTASSSAAWAARRSAPTWSAPAWPACAVPYEVVRGYELPAWVGPRARWWSRSATPATPRRRSPASTRRCRAAAGRSASPPAAPGRARRRARPAARPVPAGLQPRAAVGYLAAAIGAVLGRRPGAWLRRAGRRGHRGTAGLRRRARPRRSTSPTTTPRCWPAACSTACRSSTAPASRRRRRAAGRARSTRTPRRRPSSTSCPSSTTTSSWAGRANPARGRRQSCSCCSTTRTATSACVRRLALTPRPRCEPPRGRRGARRRPRRVAAGARCSRGAYVGDWVSFYLALLYGVDPTPVAAIEEFKARLRRHGAA